MVRVERRVDDPLQLLRPVRRCGSGNRRHRRRSLEWTGGRVMAGDDRANRATRAKAAAEKVFRTDRPKEPPAQVERREELDATRARMRDQRTARLAAEAARKPPEGRGG